MARSAPVGGTPSGFGSDVVAKRPRDQQQRRRMVMSATSPGRRRRKYGIGAEMLDDLGVGPS